jgi:hypothetical protein
LTDIHRSRFFHEMTLPDLAEFRKGRSEKYYHCEDCKDAAISR